MRSIKRLAVVSFLLAIAGCAIVPAKTSTPLLVSDKGFALSGRIAVKYDGKGFSGVMRWAHSGPLDEIFIVAPLGQTVAHIVREGEAATLTTADQKLYRATDAERLAQEVLGWSLPLRALKYWVVGVNSPHTSSDINVDGDGRVSRMRQDAWEITYLGYAPREEGGLPRAMEMRHRDLEIKLIVDQWTQPPAKP